MYLSKLEAALDALLPDLLPLVALTALDPRDVVPLEGVLLLLVVAEPAPVQAVTAGSLHRNQEYYHITATERNVLSCPENITWTPQAPGEDWEAF